MTYKKLITKIIMLNKKFFLISGIILLLLNIYSTKAQDSSKKTTVSSSPGIPDPTIGNYFVPLSYKDTKLVPRSLYMSGITPLGTKPVNRAVRFFSAQKYINQPSGLFSGTAGSSFDNFIKNLKATPQCAPLICKVQFTILHDLYIYLASIYCAFNLTTEDSVKDISLQKDSTKPIDPKQYLILESKYALNKKAIIVYHLMNLIQAQMHFICSNQIPLVPKNYQLKTGKTMYLNDKAADPNFLLEKFDEEFFTKILNTMDVEFKKENKLESKEAINIEAKKDAATIVDIQTRYLKIISEMLTFFRNYTDLIDAKKSNSDDFLKVAQNVQKRIIEYDEFHKKFKNSTEASGKEIATERVKQIRQTKVGAAKIISEIGETKVKKNKIFSTIKEQEGIRPINPPLFHYDDETLRAIRLIPQLADELPKKVETLPWPQKITKLALDGTLITDKKYRAAYFVDKNLDVTNDETQATRLFINIPETDGTDYPYAQEIKKQPEWLNSKEGIIKILKACLGDFSQLVGEDILTPCVEQILCKACEAEPFDNYCKNKCINRPKISASCAKELEKIEATRKLYMENLRKEREKEKTEQLIKPEIPEQEIDNEKLQREAQADQGAQAAYSGVNQ